MKLYRVIPNVFSFGRRLNSGTLSKVEAIYYRMGYSSFKGRVGMHKHNNVFTRNESIKEGKYFFPFLEDAIREGYYLLTRSHGLRDVGTFYIVEYDFPEDISVKHFGFGDYKEASGVQKPLMEFYVEKDDFITNQSIILRPNQISSEKEHKVLTTMLSETLKEAVSNSEVDFMWYDDYFEKNYEFFSEVVKTPQKISDVIEGSRLSLPLEGELIKSEYLTGNMVLINIPATMEKYESWQAASEYFATLGRCDFSKEQDEFKKELLYLSGCNANCEKDGKKVLALLKSRKYL